MTAHLPHVPLHFHFIDDEVQDLPANFTMPKGAAAPGMPAPNMHDLLIFDGLPGLRFIVKYREFRYAHDESAPLSVHVHLARLGAPPG